MPSSNFVPDAVVHANATVNHDSLSFAIIFIPWYIHIPRSKFLEVKFESNGINAESEKQVKYSSLDWSEKVEYVKL